MNRVMLIGRLVLDPQIFNSKNLTKYTRGKIAIKNKNKDKDEFIPLIAFNNNALFFNTYFTKGDLVIIEGRVSFSGYKNNDGDFENAANVVINQIKSLETKSIVNERRRKNGLETFDDGQTNENKDSDNGLPWELDLD